MNRRIYQIGFNKTATKAIEAYLEKNDIHCIHHDRGKLGKQIFDNYYHGRPLFYGYEEYQAFTDMEFCTNKGHIYTSEVLFKEMYYQDKDAVFILNKRKVKDLIYSRMDWMDGLYSKLEYTGKNMTKWEVKKYWRDGYHSHINNVTTFFKDKGNLIVFDIDNHDGQYLADKLAEYGYNIDAKFWKYRNVSWFTLKQWSKDNTTHDMWPNHFTQEEDNK